MKIVIEKLKFYVLISVHFLLLSGCIQQASVQPVAQKNIDPIRDIYVKIVNNSFRDPALNLKAKNLIHAKLTEIKSNYDDPSFSAYIKSGLQKHIKKNRLFTLQPPHNGMYDLHYEIHAIKSSPQNINILINIIDPRSDYIFYSVLTEYPLADFDIEKYNNFRALYKDRLHRQQLASQNARITFKMDAKGGSYKEKNKRVLVVSPFYSKSVELDTGYGGQYPADMALTINNKKFEPGNDNVFCEGEFAPGQIFCKASFRGARWDNVAKQESFVTGTITKRFLIDVKKKENLQVSIVYLYDGGEPHINIEVSKLKTVIERGIQKTRYEVIQRF